MELFQGKTDISMSLDGDLMVGSDGDLALCTGFEWLYREVNKRLRTTNPLWAGLTTIGADLHDFIGRPNTEATAKAIRQRIKTCLDRDNLAYPGEFAVRVIPTGRDSIVIYIYVILPGTRYELYKLIYSFLDGITQFMEGGRVYGTTVDTNAKVVDVDTAIEPARANKYVRAIEYSDGI